MKRLYPFAIALVVCTFASLALGREARLVRYPSYSNGRVAFTYLGDIWTADDKLTGRATLIRGSRRMADGSRFRATAMGTLMSSSWGRAEVPQNN
jgi:hypothetical protein